MRMEKVLENLNENPINGARLSSSYGKRKHPILGYTKMHTGTILLLQQVHPLWHQVMEGYKSWLVRWWWKLC